MARIDAKTITGDALLTQHKLAHYLVEERSAHYVFTAKDNQPSIAEAIRLLFENRGVPDYSEPLTPTHGRIESRSIWTSTVSVRHQSSQAVHPHGCGEHLGLLLGDTVAFGHSTASITEGLM
ncbi:hypothetical protein [Thiolapillus sp.]|uniref:hypothetical protein n=1 Tax=Thiolapillus sp. TaxID=2017437 RepID=UPI003AF69F9A